VVARNFPTKSSAKSAICSAQKFLKPSSRAARAWPRRGLSASQLFTTTNTVPARRRMKSSRRKFWRGWEGNFINQQVVRRSKFIFSFMRVQKRVSCVKQNHVETNLTLFRPPKNRRQAHRIDRKSVV